MIETVKFKEMCKYYGKDYPASGYKGVQTSTDGVKTPTSIVSKIKRNFSDVAQLDILDFTDLARCSILVDSYADVTKVIKVLQESFPGLTGDVSQNSSGYKGIHILIPIDGIYAEVQIHSKRTWPYKLIGEEYYAKWRDKKDSENLTTYASELEKLESIANPSQKDEERINWLKKEISHIIDEHNEHMREQKLSEEAWAECFNESDFDENVRQIEGMLAVINAKSRHDKLQPKPELEKHVLNAAQFSDEQTMLDYATQCSEFAKGPQEKLVKYASKASEFAENTPIAEFQIDEKSKLAIELQNLITQKISNHIKNSIYSSIPTSIDKSDCKKYIDEFSMRNKKMLSKLRFQVSIDILDYAMQNNLIGTTSAEKLFKQYSKNFEAKAENNKDLQSLSIKSKLDKKLEEYLIQSGFIKNTQVEV